MKDFPRAIPLTGNLVSSPFLIQLWNPLSPNTEYTTLDFLRRFSTWTKGVYDANSSNGLLSVKNYKPYREVIMVRNLFHSQVWYSFLKTVNNIKCFIIVSVNKGRFLIMSSRAQALCPDEHAISPILIIILPGPDNSRFYPAFWTNTLWHLQPTVFFTGEFLCFSLLRCFTSVFTSFLNKA